MKFLFLLGLASLATGGALQSNIQDVCTLMPSIVLAMLAKGPITSNKDMNTFINVLAEVQKTTQKSVAGRLTNKQFTDYGNRGITALGAATSTDRSGMSKIQSLLTAKVASSKAGGTLDGTSFISLLQEMVPSLGNGSATSKDAVAKLFMDFLPTYFAAPVVKPVKNTDLINPVNPTNSVKPVKAPVQPVKAPVPVQPVKAQVPVQPVKAPVPVKPVPAPIALKPVSPVWPTTQAPSRQNFYDSGPAPQPTSSG